MAAARDTYLFLLASTFCVSALLYFGARGLWGVPAALFLAFSTSLSHYALAYLWSVPSYARWPKKFIARNMIFFSSVLALFVALVYWPGVVSFSDALLFVVVISIVHNSRDYAFFFRQIASGFTDGRRSFVLTSFFSALSFLVIFGVLLAVPSKSGFQLILFSPQIVVPLLVLSAAWLAWSLVMLARTKGFSGEELLPVRYTLPIFLVPFALYAVGNVTALDLFYFFVIWHYILWYGYTLSKLSNTGGSPTRFLGLVAATNAVFIVPFFLLLSAGAWTDLPTAIRESFLWGLSGFVFFSFGHILFSVLPRYAVRPQQGAHHSSP